MSVTGRALQKGAIYRISRGEVTHGFLFQYNPTEQMRDLSPEWGFDSAPSAVLPHAVLQTYGADTISLQLMLDATSEYSSEKEGVGAQKAFFELLNSPDVDRFLASGVGLSVGPPEIMLVMGSDALNVVVTKLGFKDIRFNSLLFATRTEVTIEFRRVYTSIADYSSRLMVLAALRRQVERRFS